MNLQIFLNVLMNCFLEKVADEDVLSNAFKAAYVPFEHDRFGVMSLEPAIFHHIALFRSLASLPNRHYQFVTDHVSA